MLTWLRWERAEPGWDGALEPPLLRPLPLPLLRLKLKARPMEDSAGTLDSCTCHKGERLMAQAGGPALLR